MYVEKLRILSVKTLILSHVTKTEN